MNDTEIESIQQDIFDKKKYGIKWNIQCIQVQQQSF